MKRKTKGTENYLDKIPVASPLKWTSDDNGTVTLEIENKGIVNRIAQFVLKKPKITYIHLDEIGSFVWPMIDGKATIGELAEQVGERFGEAANPLYERLVKYFQILESYNFISF